MARRRRLSWRWRIRAQPSYSSVQLPRSRRLACGSCVWKPGGGVVGTMGGRGGHEGTVEVRWENRDDVFYYIM